ncbi:molybdopterin molybdenumtransferase [Methanobrevibacter cuticularis]|uniref:Molybdopterin molybdenumtransferase n=1 Tax=Methanobrevibacter cuticularis TaxID=47311 RepID=A0A166D2Y6_9EURY|nr:gephyrin-like molybdotransferase Glp [Methanobrevibacter cuticularis]KZX15155.1 molybdopterin molybdenumtransferase [Methanobrevibacter cuticularis]
MFLSELIPLSEASAILKKNQIIMPKETIDLTDSYLRVLSEEIKSFHDSPPFDKSAMDGYAVIAENTFGASSNLIKKIKIIDQIGAGDFSDKLINEGEAIRIATGAPIPNGANAVLMEEYTITTKNENDDEIIEIHSQVTPGENVADFAEDIKKGEKIVSKNTLIRPQEMGLIASAGLDKVEVYQKPRIKLITTGNELVEPSKKLDRAQIINSNQYVIGSMIKSCGADVNVGHAHDRIEEVKKTILNDSNNYDVIITTGGTAISKGDVVVDAVESLGEVLFHGVALRPGKPVAFGIVNSTPIFMLSGYPVGAMGQFDALVREYLFKMQNIDYSPRIEKRISSAKIYSNLGRTDFIRAYADENNVKYVLNRGSGIIRSMVEANSYIVVDENQEGIDKGEIVNVLFFDLMNWNR